MASPLPMQPQLHYTFTLTTQLSLVRGQINQTYIKKNLILSRFAQLWMPKRKLNGNFLQLTFDSEKETTCQNTLIITHRRTNDPNRPCKYNSSELSMNTHDKTTLSNTSVLKRMTQFGFLAQKHLDYSRKYIYFSWTKTIYIQWLVTTERLYYTNTKQLIYKNVQKSVEWY